MENELLTKSVIKERGWTEGAIKKFLGNPEITKKNPHYRTGPPMLLWRLETVLEAEQTSQFIEWKNKHDTRREQLRTRAINQHQQKRTLLMEWVESLDVKVPKYSKGKLFQFAINNYNELWSSRGEHEKLIYQEYSQLNPDFLHRITVNALLHALSDYEYHLAKVANITGAPEARSRLTERMLTEINKTYPDVAYPELLEQIKKTEPADEQDAERPPSKIVRLITGLCKELARAVASDPKSLDEIEWRDMERMLAEVFDDLGFDVELTSSSKDGGKDIVLECTFQGTRQTYIVEVKHWRSGQRVGTRYISDFVNVVAREKRDGGLYLATYGYSGDACEAIAEVDRQIVKLGTEQKIVSLCRTFVKSEKGVWSVPSVMSDLLFDNVS